MFLASFLSRALPGAAVSLSLLALAALSAPAARAQAYLSFSGGNGTPLTLTLATPITYTVTTRGDFAPVFVFDAVGTYNFFSLSTTGTNTYTINGGAPQTIRSLTGGNPVGDITRDDFFLSGNSSTTVNPGDVVVLSSGTLTTNQNFTGAPPASGAFTTFLAEGRNANRISGNGVSAAPPTTAPEPGTIALLLTAGVPVVGIIRRRKSK